MELRVCVLASGSSGNSVYVGSESTGILVDAGLSCREIERRLAAVGLSLTNVRAVCLTHEHEDHKAGVGILHRRAGLPLYANAGTIEALQRDAKLRGVRWTVFTTGQRFAIGDLAIEPFSVPHDSYDPVGFVIEAGGARVGVVTDMGMPTTLIRERLRNCGVLILESNHDEDLLRDAPRPWSLKQRIRGRQGHLSNRQAGELLDEVAGPLLRHVFLAHLSTDCNHPPLALEAVQRILGRACEQEVRVWLTYPDRVSEFVTIAGGAEKPGGGHIP